MRGALSAYDASGHVVTCTLSTQRGAVDLSLPKCTLQMRRGWYYEISIVDDTEVASQNTIFMGRCYRVDDNTLSVCGLAWKASGDELWPGWSVGEGEGESVARVVKVDRSPNVKKRKA